ncbi:high mobility group nucleosome-binding domain-containing protein 5-like [Haliotis rubra]|uniref:high mobility group nucleosome-binding domain-containing protein 5-like n=1 Tax=Haliotis rubra TaxID=36100 RepID=UPI001EE5504B|nr:high mobility group nucleosome-binding domain-containing protein 5-like [Haliotis rubra]
MSDGATRRQGRKEHERGNTEEQQEGRNTEREDGRKDTHKETKEEQRNMEKEEKHTEERRTTRRKKERRTRREKDTKNTRRGDGVDGRTKGEEQAWMDQRGGWHDQNEENTEGMERMEGTRTRKKGMEIMEGEENGWNNGEKKSVWNKNRNGSNGGTMEWKDLKEQGWRRSGRNMERRGSGKRRE